MFDALSTKRPYRDAWPSAKILGYLEERAGLEFDPDIVATFIRMFREGEARVRVLDEDGSAPPPSQPKTDPHERPRGVRGVAPSKF